jgi:hypothetical protein
MFLVRRLLMTNSPVARGSSEPPYEVSLPDATSPKNAVDQVFGVLTMRAPGQAGP